MSNESKPPSPPSSEQPAVKFRPSPNPRLCHHCLEKRGTMKTCVWCWAFTIRPELFRP